MTAPALSTWRAALAAVKRPALAVAHSYDAAARRRPVVTGLVTTVVKTSAADLFAQKVVEGRDEIDLARHSVFCAFGFFYLGGFQYYLYNRLFARWCAPITRTFGHRGAAPVKTFIDQAIHHPFLYFPTFYLTKGYVEGRPLASTYDRYRAELWDNCKALWTIWVPAQLFNFSMVPGHLRIPFIAGVSFAWTVVISCMRGALDVAAAAEAPTVNTGDGADLRAPEHGGREEARLLRAAAAGALSPAAAAAVEAAVVAPAVEAAVAAAKGEAEGLRAGVEAAAVGSAPAKAPSSGAAAAAAVAAATAAGKGRGTAAASPAEPAAAGLKDLLFERACGGGGSGSSGWR